MKIPETGKRETLMAGRNTDLTEGLIDEISQVLAAGNYKKVAAAYVGISEACFMKWQARGLAEEKRIISGEKPIKKEAIYLQFVESVKKASAKSEVRDVALIANAAKDGNWQAAAWRLERKHWQRWGRKDKVDLKAKVTLSLDDLIEGDKEDSADV